MRVERSGPASTGWLIVSIFFANKLWISDATSMSLHYAVWEPLTAQEKANLAFRLESDQCRRQIRDTASFSGEGI
jgi:hypothetical protein